MDRQTCSGTGKLKSTTSKELIRYLKHSTKYKKVFTSVYEVVKSNISRCRIKKCLSLLVSASVSHCFSHLNSLLIPVMLVPQKYNVLFIDHYHIRYFSHKFNMTIQPTRSIVYELLTILPLNFLLQI